ncbi:MAG: glycerophosphodiester phosphodiesterase family protein [Planctomycetota bacterium]|nr:glycerophosphodiester phosphodiesterase family protein [Planctomycetota bacterium]
MTGGAPRRPLSPRRNIYEGLSGLEVSGAHLTGPPLLLGHRGAPREAPENTLAALRRALEAGLDGVEYDVRACGSGDLVLFHDARMERTTDHQGALCDMDMRDLFSVDAGGWFAKHFAGEPVPLLDEALSLTGEARGTEPPFHMIELKEPGLISRLCDLLEERRPPVPCRVASFRRDVVLEARDAGLSTMLLGLAACEDDRRFVRDERIDAYSVGPRGWKGEAGTADWSFTERWAWAIDDPDELLELCRQPLFGLNSNEPHRALGARALARMLPDSTALYPVQVPELFIEPETLDVRSRGEWFGDWSTAATVLNPFPFAVEARAAAFVPHGAFEIEGLPRVLELEAGEERSVEFRIRGGAREPGPDPLLGVLYSWQAGRSIEGSVRSGGSLLLDAPMVRRRAATADGLARRLELLAERPGDPPASITARRAGRDMVLSIENAGGLAEPHLVARLGLEVARGGRGLRLRLPERFDDVPLGVEFSCGIEGLTPEGERRVRRWAGGLPAGLGHGAPGLLIPLARG